MGSFAQELNGLKQTLKSAFAEKACEIMMEEAKKAIDYFYDDYDPDFYNRVDNFRNNSATSIIDRKNGIGGVRMSSDTMDDYRSSTFGSYGAYIDPSMAFKHAMFGIHGSLQKVPRKTNPSVYMWLNNALGDRDNMRKIEEYMWQEAKKKSYSTFTIK